MPVSRYNEFFGGKRGSAAKARKRMHESYGREDGEHVFRAVIAKKRKRKGKAR